MQLLVASLLLAALLATQCAADPVTAAKGLVTRLLGEEYVGRFQYEVIARENGQDVFEVDSTPDGTPVLRGNNGVSLATALNYYLKYHCNCSVSWGDNGSGDQLQLPQPLPSGFDKVRVVFIAKYRYYMNVCTVSYSMVWWDIDRWTREIDWMALNGINMPLAFTGQEYVWKKFYQSLGLNESEINSYFSGPAFLAWQRMGNIKGWAGPLDDEWIGAQYKLQLAILEQSREFGMLNVLPGFAGHVPEALKLLYPNNTFIKNSNWGRFNSTYSGDYLLEPTDPLFVTLGKQYYSLLISEYGTDHFYNADTYNEMQPSSNDPSFLAATNKAIYEAIASADKEGVFVMQGWLFQNTGYWTPGLIQAFLSGVPNDKMVILDLSATQRPVWSRTDSFYGKPFIYCLLHNFGGMRGIYGNLAVIASDPLHAANASSYAGIGITPEAIEQNPVVYDMMLEMGWRRKAIDVDSWVEQYAVRRYGNVEGTVGDNLLSAWHTLRLCCYGEHGFSWSFKSLIERAPAIAMMTNDNWLQFTDTTLMVKALGQLITGHDSPQLQHVGPYRYDVVDITRQAVTNLFTDVQYMFGLAYQKWQFRYINSTVELTALANTMMELMTDLNLLLASNENFLLGRWIGSARNGVTSEAAKDLYEYNARNQVTMWGYRENIEDYASKQWAGLVGDYYMGRWYLFIKLLIACTTTGNRMDFDDYEQQRFELEQKWGNERTTYPSQPTGDSLQIAFDLYERYISVQGSSLTYKEMVNSNIVGDDANLYGGYRTPWTKDLNQLRFLCDANPTCVGFSSLGWVFNSTVTITTTTSVTLYLKQV